MKIQLNLTHQIQNQNTRFIQIMLRWIFNVRLSYNQYQIIQFLQRMLKGQYQLLKGYENNHVTIGFGSYGQVKLAKNLDSGDIVAVKIINKLAKNQIIFHDKLSHSNIVQLLNYQIDKDRQITYMVLQYADGGTLFQRIKSSLLTKTQIRNYFRDVCEAILYLHSKQIMHRDIKPQNILLTKKGQAKLCDFGFAAILGERKTLCGTYEYMSLEMIQNRFYDSKIDIWALGILLFQMISGQAPFRGQSPQEVLNQMKTKIFFCERFKTEEINLIKMILRVTPHKRPSVHQILQNSFFNQDTKTDQTSETEASQIKKLSSISSNSNLQTSKYHFKSQNAQFYKKPEKPQNSKQPQNSYPFYVPKAKYHTGGSTGSTGNSGSGASTKIIMPQHISSKADSTLKSGNISPKRREAGEILEVQYGQQKNPKNASQNVQNIYSGSVSGIVGHNKGLNKSMGYNLKEKFNLMDRQQIEPINKNLNQEGKNLNSGVSRNKKLFYQSNKVGSSRFS